MQTMDKISTPAIDKNRLKSKWVEKGYLQSDIARELQLSPAGFSRKINGKTDFSLSEIHRICYLLDLTADDREAIFFAK